MRLTYCSLLLLVIVNPVFSQSTYQRPPQAVLDILHAPRAPQPSLSPDRSYLILAERVAYPPVAELARPILRLAGLRIDAASNGVRNPRYIQSLSLKRLSDGTDLPVTLPVAPRIREVLWSPDSRSFAFLQTTPTKIELWIGDTATGHAHVVPQVAISDVTGDAAQWMPDGRSLLVQVIPAGRGAPPAEQTAPAGPAVQETSGRLAPVRTFEDLLSDSHDEALFDYYATSQLALLDAASGRLTPIGHPAIFEQAQPAPDGEHLLVSRLHRPYSYLHPYSYFPRTVEVWDRQASVLYKAAEQPLAEIPIEGVRTGPRNFEWQPTAPATLIWAEALDGGNPKETVPHRDRVLSFAAPYHGEPVEVVKTEHRYGGLEWGDKDGLLLLTDIDRKQRNLRVFVRQNGVAGDRVLTSRNLLDRYHDIGHPLTKRLPNGESVLLQDGNSLYLAGAGAGPKGDYPFLDRLDLSTLHTERLFQSAPEEYEQVVAILDPHADRFLTIRENPSTPPNLFIRSRKDSSVVALTHYTDPAPQFAGVKHELVTYQRPDGVQLSFTLYLPPDYQAGTRLPTVLWAYPLEHNDPATAGQITGSNQQFTRPVSYSHLFFLLEGYAVLDNVAMPVVGDPETVNNTYIEQIVADAKAAIDKAVEMGVTDRNRIGVGGHSYGAFMTANLLANCDFFRAGIARSGAYNRTLTPFGFQSERRTFWEAPDIYLRMSPFLKADKIKTPILFIHGEADDNQGTFPIQSERMYQAVRGNGGTARLVMLPYEAHGYVASESVEHTLYEMIHWFDRYVKNAAPEKPATE